MTEPVDHRALAGEARNHARPTLPADFVQLGILDALLAVHDLIASIQAEDEVEADPAEGALAPGWVDHVADAWDVVEQDQSERAEAFGWGDAQETEDDEDLDETVPRPVYTPTPAYDLDPIALSSFGDLDETVPRLASRLIPDFRVTVRNAAARAVDLFRDDI
jgi:hypothetical protein